MGHFMSRQNSKKSDSWAAGILAEMAATAATKFAPPGWFTPKELAKVWNCTPDAADYRARRRASEGEFACASFMTSSGKAAKHYTLSRLAQPKNSKSGNSATVATRQAGTPSKK